MALSQRHRSTIYTKLQPILGEEETEALLAQFPAREMDEPATREFVHAEMQALRGEMHERFGSLQSEMHERFGSLQAEMHDLIRSQTTWFAGSILTGVALAATLARIVG